MDAKSNNRREYFQKYQEENRDRLNEYQREWRAEHPEKVKEYNKRYWMKKLQLSFSEG